jgi:hypothetical protein
MTNAISLAMMLATNCWNVSYYTNGVAPAWEIQGITIPAKAVWEITVTNSWHPKQYKSVFFYSTYPLTTEETWEDSPPWLPQGMTNPTRDNPNVKMVEVRKLTYFRYQYDRTWFTNIVCDVVLSTKILRRIVETKEEWKEEMKP